MLPIARIYASEQDARGVLTHIIDAGGVGKPVLDYIRSNSPLTANARGISLHGGACDLFKLLLVDQESGSAVLQQFMDRRARKAVVERNKNRPNLSTGKVEVEVLDTIA